MKHYDVQNRLIDRTITVIAENGLDKTTTKAIVKGTEINEAYIYRYFSDKEDLLSHVFDTLDEELVAKVMQHLPVMYMRELEYELRCRVFLKQFGSSCLVTRKSAWRSFGIIIRRILQNILPKAINAAMYRSWKNSRKPSRMRQMCG